MSDVFVSYKAEDRKRVQPLVQALQADGCTVWWDEHIATGDEWRETIERELDAAKCVIVIWSKRSVGPEGHFVRDEAARAQRRHVYVPVLIDAVDPPLGFGESQAASLRGWRGDRADSRYQAIIAAVRRIAGQDSADDARLPFARKLVTRRAVFAGGAVAIVAAAGVGAWELFKPGASASDSIAVLPFANLSGDPDEAYFSDGIAEEIRSVLALVPGLEVIGRVSSEAVGDERNLTSVAHRLHAGSILTGSVRRSSSTIRVTAQLVTGKSGVEQWSQTYDRPVGDALKIEADIAQSVASALSFQIGELADLNAGGTNNDRAYDLMLKSVGKARYYSSEADLQQAVSLADEAIDLDSHYARAYAEKAFAVYLLTGRFAIDSAHSRAGYSLAESAARKAIDLAPRVVRGHVVLAKILTAQLHFGAALSEYRQAAAVDSGSSDFLTEYSQFLDQLGQPNEGLAQANRAVALDPLNPRAVSMQATAYLIGKRYNEALESGKHVLRLAPDRQAEHNFLGDVLTLLGRTDEARAQYSQSPPDDLFRLTSEAILAARSGDRRTSDERLARVLQLYGDSVYFQLAQMHAQRRETAEAVDALNRALAARDPGISWVRVDPWLEPLHGDPRYSAIVNALRFPSLT
jgi:TolB-like protein/Tfp pilus assembly protein PilF